MSTPAKSSGPPDTWRTRFTRRRNRIIGNPRFQYWLGAIPFTRGFIRRKAAKSFNLFVGYSYSQTMGALVESGLIEALRDGPMHEEAMAELISVRIDRMQMLMRAAASLDMVEPLGEGWWTLGEEGAALASNEGALAMMRHHAILYADLLDPLSLLRDEREGPTKLRQYWNYDPEASPDDESAPYSQLMAVSQAMVSEQAVAAYDFSQHKRILDVGGGYGVFLSAIAKAAPDAELGLFDLPGVMARAGAALKDKGVDASLHPGSFVTDPLPTGYDCITLVRICHDHDDPVVEQLIQKAHDALAPGGRLLIIEPLSETPHGRAILDAYFGWYLLAMGQGRPRRDEELGGFLDAAGFARWREAKTRLPVITRVLVADY